jgi:ketosteroid isomerase-like protein
VSSGHGRIQRIILETVAQSPRYCFTDSDLVGHVFEAYDEEITESHIAAVRKAVRALLAEGVLVERPGHADRHRMTSAAPARQKGATVRLRAPRVTADGPAWLRCGLCDVEWQRQDAELCWSCGMSGVPSTRPTA